MLPTSAEPSMAFQKGTGPGSWRVTSPGPPDWSSLAPAEPDLEPRLIADRIPTTSSRVASSKSRRTGVSWIRRLPSIVLNRALALPCRSLGPWIRARGPQRGQGLAAQPLQRLHGLAVGVPRRVELLHQRRRVAGRFRRLPQQGQDDQVAPIHRRFPGASSKSKPPR